MLPVAPFFPDLAVRANVGAGPGAGKPVRGWNQSNIEDGERCDTGYAFLNAGVRQSRPNLTVATLAHVTRILFQGTTAIGVELRRGSTDPAVLRASPSQVVLARREVVVCAGAVNSPWLLQLSGVGPRTVLAPLGIPVVADVPVGEVCVPTRAHARGPRRRSH